MENAAPNESVQGGLENSDIVKAKAEPRDLKNKNNLLTFGAKLSQKIKNL